MRETGRKRGTEDTADAVEAEGAAVGTVEAEGAAVAAGTVEQEGAAIAERAVEPESPAGPERTPAQFYSPMNGRILPVSQSADEMFASRALGDGIAVDPADGLVCAPCDGTVTMIFPTGHAMGIASDSGFEVQMCIRDRAISDVEGVKGVFLTQSQFQIIFGAGLVNLICDEVQKQLGTVQESREEEPDVYKRQS